jgi:hypothetical protein
LAGPEQRPAEDVWRQIQHIAREHMESGEPILTIERKTPNHITSVDDRRIHRHSAKAVSKTGNDASVSKGQVVAIWNHIMETGTSKGAPGLRFAFALVACLPGIGINSTGNLYVEDAKLALTTFHQPSTSLLHSLISQFRSLRRSGPRDQKTLHKPLMLLIALARLRHGDTLLPYDEVDVDFADLAPRYFPSKPPPDAAANPFVRLTIDGDFWAVHPPQAGGTQHPSGVVLRDQEARAGFTKKYLALLQQPAAMYTAVRSILEDHFPENTWVDLLQRLELSDALLDSFRSSDMRNTLPPPPPPRPGFCQLCGYEFVRPDRTRPCEAVNACQRRRADYPEGYPSRSAGAPDYRAKGAVD